MEQVLNTMRTEKKYLIDTVEAMRLAGMAGEPGDYSPLLTKNTAFSMALYSRMKQHRYCPKCIVEYDRKAYCLTENDTRVTLDSGLRSTFINLNLFDPGLLLTPAGSLSAVVMEVKYNHFLLSYVKDMASLSNRTQTFISKYCAARMALFGIG